MACQLLPASLDSRKAIYIELRIVSGKYAQVSFWYHCLINCCNGARRGHTVHVGGKRQIER